jgi:hypothetical protein
MKILTSILFLIILSCGESSKVEEEKDLNLKILRNDEFEIPDVTEEKLDELKILLDEFVKNGSDIKKFKKIENIIRSFEVKKKVIEILEKKRLETPNDLLLSFLLKKLYYYNEYFKIQKYEYKPIFELTKNNNALDIELENIMLHELVNYSIGEKMTLEGSNNYFLYLEKRFDLKYIDVRDYFKDSEIREYNRDIIINLKNLNYRFKAVGVVLVSDKNLIIYADDLYFDLISGIKVLNGKNLEISAKYIQNGIFFTGVNEKLPRAADGKNGRNASRNNTATSGKPGANGLNGKNGGDIIFDIEKIPNSMCDTEVCRTVVITNGQNGQNGGNGGRGGNGITYYIEEVKFGYTDLVKSSECIHKELIEYKPKKGGSPGEKGKKGLSGKVEIRRTLFNSNSFLIYDYDGIDGINGNIGIKGKNKK